MKFQFLAEARLGEDGTGIGGCRSAADEIRPTILHSFPAMNAPTPAIAPTPAPAQKKPFHWGPFVLVSVLHLGITAAAAYAFLLVALNGFSNHPMPDQIRGPLTLIAGIFTCVWSLPFVASLLLLRSFPLAVAVAAGWSMFVGRFFATRNSKPAFRQGGDIGETFL